MNSQLAEVTSTANDRPVKKPFASESRVLTAENRALRFPILQKVRKENKYLDNLLTYSSMTKPPDI